MSENAETILALAEGKLGASPGNGVPTIGARSKISIGGTTMEVLRSTMGAKQALISRNGIRGDWAHLATDQRLGPQAVGGTLEMEPSASELATLMGYTIATSGNALTDFTMIEDKGGAANNASVFTYSGCKIGKAVLSGTQGAAIKLTLDVVAKTETQSGNSPAVASSGYPFVFSDITLTMTSGRECHSFELTIDNKIDAGRFLNALTMSYVQEMDRMVHLRATLPATNNNTDLYPMAITGIVGPTLAMTDCSNTTKTFTFGTLQSANDAPEIPGKSEIMLTLAMVAGATANTADIALA